MFFVRHRIPNFEKICRTTILRASNNACCFSRKIHLWQSAGLKTSLLVCGICCDIHKKMWINSEPKHRKINTILHVSNSLVRHNSRWIYPCFCYEPGGPETEYKGVDIVQLTIIYKIVTKSNQRFCFPSSHSGRKTLSMESTCFVFLSKLNYIFKPIYNFLPKPKWFCCLNLIIV